MNSHRLIPVILAAVGAATALPAQNVAIPGVAAVADGNDARSYPFGRTAFRMQQVIEAKAVSATQAIITAISFRPDNGNSIGSKTALFPNVTIEMSHTGATPSTMSTAYASNVTTPPTQVFSGMIALGAYTSTSLGIAPWDTIVLTTPFGFDPSQGDLLIDIVATDPNGSLSTSWIPDTARTGGPREVYGQAGAFSASPLDWPKMTVTASFNSQGNMAGIGIGGMLTYIVSSGSPLGGGVAYSGAVLFGVQELPVPFDLTGIGAPGSFLYFPSFMSIPFQLQQGPIGGPSWNMPINVPNNPALFRAKLHTQPIYQDVAANALGWVAGNAIRITLGDSVSMHPANQVSGNDPNAISGGFVFTSGILGNAVVGLSVQ